MTDEQEQPTMEELLELRARLRNYHSDEDFDDAQLPLNEDPRFSKEPDSHNLETLRRWVQWYKAKLDADPNGGIFDTSMRCVTEGGEIIYLDPEIIVALMDERDALREACRAHETR